MKAVEILRELVAIPTPSAASNLSLLAWVTRYVEAKGWRAQLFPYPDDGGVAKANLIGRPASSPKVDSLIDLAFICHTGTVPFAAKSATALDFQTLGGYAHGCGACDVKGALARFLAALNLLTPSQTNPNIALILTATRKSAAREWSTSSQQSACASVPPS
ncbi:MAG: M20/M25/M40 family metallo-hydrolase [Terracidiphilus sp.]|jgi:acetylornithine deacetylase